MNNINIYIGSITSIIDYENAEIEFTVPNVVVSGKAYSMYMEKKPAIGDEVVLLRMNSHLNSMWYYLNIIQSGEFILHYGDAKITFINGVITISGTQINLTTPSDAESGGISGEAQPYLLGSRVADWLNELLDIMTNELTLLTPQGPTGPSTPEATARIELLRAKIESLKSQFIQSSNN